ncbi:MAG: glycogen phosphorylase, partial [Ilumatobacteraceae bacterium]|jgi:starch phosphorylase
MVREYTSELYEPAAASANAMLDDNSARGKALAHWKQHVLDAWADVKVVDLDVDTSSAHEGDQRSVRARVELGGLDAGEVTVEALHGPIDSTGSFVTTPATVTLTPTGDGTFEGTYEVGEAGPYGVTVRAVPHHGDLINPMDLGVVAWAG